MKLMVPSFMVLLMSMLFASCSQSPSSPQATPTPVPTVALVDTLVDNFNDADMTNSIDPANFWFATSDSGMGGISTVDSGPGISRDEIYNNNCLAVTATVRPAIGSAAPYYGKFHLITQIFTPGPVSFDLSSYKRLVFQMEVIENNTGTGAFSYRITINSGAGYILTYNLTPVAGWSWYAISLTDFTPSFGTVQSILSDAQGLVIETTYTSFNNTETPQVTVKLDNVVFSQFP